MLESDYMKKLGSSIRFYRTKANLTQGELASQIGKSLASVSKYERGDCAIDCYTLSEIASALDQVRYPVLILYRVSYQEIALFGSEAQRVLLRGSSVRRRKG